jgi:hypothetical protein
MSLSTRFLRPQRVPSALKLGVDPGRAIRVATAFVDLPNALGESVVFAVPLGGRPVPPVVVSAPGDSEHPAHQLDGKAPPLRLDEAIATHRVPSSCAKKTAAFFRNSLSCLRTLTSRRSLLNSSRSSVVSPSRLPSSTSCCLRSTSSVTRWLSLELLGHLRDRLLVRGAIELDGLPFEFRRVVRCWSRHDRTSSPGTQ